MDAGMPHARQAPALRHRVGCGAVVAWALAAAAAAGLACVAAWLAWGAGAAAPAERIAALAVCGLCAGGALRAWRRMPRGWLLHQGGAWALEHAARSDARPLQDLRMHLDLQHALLLSARQPGAGVGRCWLWLEHGPDAAQWALLRCVAQAHCSRRAQRTIDTTPPAQGGQ
jgi:hypothetical protein